MRIDGNQMPHREVRGQEQENRASARRRAHQAGDERAVREGMRDDGAEMRPERAEEMPDGSPLRRRVYDSMHGDPVGDRLAAPPQLPRRGRRRPPGSRPGPLERDRQRLPRAPHLGRRGRARRRRPPKPRAA